MPRRPATSVLFPYTTLFRSLNGAMQSLCWKIDIPYEEGARPIVVFNPHSWPVRAGLELESRRVHDGDTLVDADGAPVAFKLERSLATVAEGSRTRLSFVADVPAFGYQMYRLVPRLSKPEPPALS